MKIKGFRFCSYSISSPNLYISGSSRKHRYSRRKKYNMVIDELCKKGKMKYALKLFKDLCDLCDARNMKYNNMVIDGLCKKGKMKYALKLFKDLCEQRKPYT